MKINTENVKQWEFFEKCFLGTDIILSNVSKLNRIVNRKEYCGECIDNIGLEFIVMNIQSFTFDTLLLFWYHVDNGNRFGYINALIYDELLNRDFDIHIGSYTRGTIINKILTKEEEQRSMLLWIVDISHLFILYNTKPILKIILKLDEQQLEKVLHTILYSDAKTCACYDSIIQRCETLCYDSEYLQKVREKYSY